MMSKATENMFMNAVQNVVIIIIIVCLFRWTGEGDRGKMRKRKRWRTMNRRLRSLWLNAYSRRGENSTALQ